MFDEVALHAPPTVQKQGKHSTLYHLANLTFGFLALSLSGYILSHSISTISASFSLSSSLLGVTLLSFATTLPEKLVSVFSSQRGESGIVIANTAGSNIFLVTLCAGVLFCSGDLASLKLEGVTMFEVGAMWLSSVVLFGIVMYGGRRWMGWALFGAYVAFIGGEFVLDRT
jgi:Ca2+/Na+ antiporter